MAVRRNRQRHSCPRLGCGKKRQTDAQHRRRRVTGTQCRKSARPETIVHRPEHIAARILDASEQRCRTGLRQVQYGSALKCLDRHFPHRRGTLFAQGVVCIICVPRDTQNSRKMRGGSVLTSHTEGAETAADAHSAQSPATNTRLTDVGHRWATVFRPNLAAV
jgi:hypothetical protein